MHCHANGGAELIDKRIKSFLLKEFGAKVTWSSTNTPELNAVSERQFRTLGEMTLAMFGDKCVMDGGPGVYSTRPQKLL